MTTAFDYEAIGPKPPRRRRGAREIFLSLFSYESLELRVAETARETATEIRTAQCRFIADVITIGRNLVRIKKILPHSAFGKWLDAEFGWAERTAQNFMASAEAFGENPQRVAGLPLRLVYTIATCQRRPGSVFSGWSTMERDPPSRRSPPSSKPAEMNDAEPQPSNAKRGAAPN